MYMQKMKRGVVPEVLQERIASEKNVDTLDRWVKLAA